MATKATLKIILMANETEVAESDDPMLWQKVLGAINGGTISKLDIEKQTNGNLTQDQNEIDASDDPIVKFAKTLNVSVPELKGALSPSSEAPYLHLDHHCWEQMKKSTPSRGPGALSPVPVAATLLALWLKEANLDVQPTQALALAVLRTIGVQDRNPGRGITNSDWLQARAGGQIVINAAQYGKAIKIARSFCTKKWELADASS